MERYNQLVLGVFACLLAIAASSSARADAGRVLIVAPHEDDETIACAGVIAGAVQRGDDVHVLLVTTGGVGDRARERLVQTFSALQLLGVPKENVIYLGYEERIVLMCAYNSRTMPDALCPGFENIQTFAPPDIATDYHTAKHGAPADYTRANILGDVTSVLEELRPQDIYMPALMESQNDHAAAALIVTEAIIGIQKRARYSPFVHEYMIYRNGLPQASLNALETVSGENADLDSTPYPWNAREALPVPKEMYGTLDGGTNLKHFAYWRYGGAVEGYSRFIKADEVFWKKQMASLSYQAHASASSESSGRPAQNAIDGVALGVPFQTSTEESVGHDFGVHEWVADSEASDIRIRLVWRRPVLLNQVRLYDRPSAENQITGGELAFSNGPPVAVGALPNPGSPLLVRFSPRLVTWLEFRVTSFVGTAGLSELEAYYVPTAIPSIHFSDLRDTAADVTISFPDELATGNRLLWRQRGTRRVNQLWPDHHVTNGSYFINGLSPNSTYDFYLLFETAFGRTKHLVRSIETTEPEPPTPAPACRNCTLRLESASATSITVTVVYPDSNAWGNGLIYSDLTTGELRDFGTPMEIHDGTYTITELTPNNMYDIDLVYYDASQPAPWIDNRITAATLPE